MIEKIGEYWKDWQLPPLDRYGISVNIADGYSLETKALRQKLARMCHLRRWLSFRMRKELRHRKQSEFLAIVMQRGEEAMIEVAR